MKAQQMIQEAREALMTYDYAIFFSKTSVLVDILIGNSKNTFNQLKLEHQNATPNFNAYIFSQRLSAFVNDANNFNNINNLKIAKIHLNNAEYHLFFKSLDYFVKEDKKNTFNQLRNEFVRQGNEESFYNRVSTFLDSLETLLVKKRRNKIYILIISIAFAFSVSLICLFIYQNYENSNKTEKKIIDKNELNNEPNSYKSKQRSEVKNTPTSPKPEPSIKTVEILKEDTEDEENKLITVHVELNDYIDRQRYSNNKEIIFIYLSKKNTYQEAVYNKEQGTLEVSKKTKKVLLLLRKNKLPTDTLYSFIVTDNQKYIVNDWKHLNPIK